ncbi:MAG: DUF6056 family protein [Treponema sp.]|jgi:hypothetical protein|nr:DUF6056 family protein [Treponema sp.]
MITATKNNRFFKAPIILCGVTLVFFALNMWTPLIADDFSLADVSGTDKRIVNLADIFESLCHYYSSWGGRLPSFFFGHLFVAFGKFFFNISNAAVYLLFMLLVYFHASGSLKKFNPLVFMAINILFWFAVPAWGENFLWLNGSVVYLWPAAFALLFLVPYRMKMENNAYAINVPCALLFFCAGVLAGCGNETLGASVISLLIAYFVVKCRSREKIALFEISGCAGFLAGFIILLAAPGSHLRAAGLDFSAQYFQLPHLIKSSALAVWRFFESGVLPAGLIAVIAIEFFYRQKKKVHYLFLLPFTAAGFAGFFSMAASPEFPPRASFTGLIFLYIILINLVVQIRVPEKTKASLPALAVVLLLVFGYSFANAAKDIFQVHLLWKKRIAYILSQKEKGILDVEIAEPIPTAATYGGKVAYQANKYMARGNDIATDPSQWPNTAIAFYFGLKSIRGIDNGDSIW